jgi:hypothetical protein
MASMTMKTIRILAAASLVLATVVQPVPAQQPAKIQGGILDPSGAPAAGFIAVVKDVDSGKEYRSKPSNEAGEYTLEIPAGTRYRLLAVVAPDGTVLPVQEIPPLPVRVPGTYQLDVKFRFLSEESGEKPPELAKPGDPGQARPKPRPGPAEDKPWYKKPAGVIGIIAGVGVVGVAVGGGSDDAPASEVLPD